MRLGDREPTRVSLRRAEGGLDFNLRLGGREIGVLKVSAPTESALCSGPTYGERCQLRGALDTFVLPRNSGSRQQRRE